MKHSVKLIVLVILIGLAFRVGAQSVVVPEDKEIALAGEVRRVLGYGPPGYGEDKKRDSRIAYWVLELAKAVNVRVLYIGYPSAGLYLDAPLDGTDIAVHGPRTEDGTTYSARSIGRREFLIVTKRYGKVLSQGTLELSSDGRTITESWLNPDRPADKGTLVYDKK